MTQEQNNPVVVERSEGVVTLRFNRPQALNAISLPLAEAFLRETQAIAADPNVRVVVLTGEGRGFMAGGDLQTLRADPEGGASALIQAMNEATLLLAGMNAPVIAKVHGVAAGAGLSLVLQADFVVAADNTVFNMAYIHLGASCDVGASWFLPRIVGLRKATEILMLSEALTAPQALQLGLVSRVVPALELDKEVETLATRLSAGPTRAYGEMKRLLANSLGNPLQESLLQERDAFLRCARTQDFQVGVAAFLEKKRARFAGC